MKVFSLLLLMCSTFLFAQEKDNFNTVLFNEIIKIPIETSKQKPVLFKQLDDILSVTKDTLLIRRVSEYKEKVEQIEFFNEIPVDISKIDLKSKKEFKIREDKFQQVTFIKPKQSTNDFYPYLVIDKGIMYMRLVTNYSGNGWIFMEKAIILIDGEKFTYNLGNTDREVNSGGSVSESSDVVVDVQTMDILRKIANSKDLVEIRLTGDKYRDRTFSKKEILKIQNALNLYDEFEQTVN